MIDLETLGTQETSAILSIGAAQFLYTGEILTTFKRNITLNSNLELERTTDSETLAWWSRQSPEAKLGLVDPSPIDARVAAQDFCDWYPSRPTEIWTNGASFDFPILKNFMEVPWQFWQEMCLRPIKFIGDNLNHPYPKKVAHDALEDVLAQVKYLTEVLNFIEQARLDKPNKV